MRRTDRSLNSRLVRALEGIHDILLAVAIDRGYIDEDKHEAEFISDLTEPSDPQSAATPGQRETTETPEQERN
jgi:hypothetical protein